MLTKTHSLPFPFLFSVQRCRPERSYVVLSAAERPAALALLRSKKRNGKTLMLTKTHSLPFPFLFFLSNAAIPSSSLSSFMSPRASVERSDGRGRFLGSGPKTVGKRNSFPGFSFFECPSFALFLFLSCGDADVSSAIGLVILFWFVFLFIFAYE